MGAPEWRRRNGREMKIGIVEGQGRSVEVKQAVEGERWSRTRRRDKNEVDLKREAKLKKQTWKLSKSNKRERDALKEKTVGNGNVGNPRGESGLRVDKLMIRGIQHGEARGRLEHEKEFKCKARC